MATKKTTKKRIAEGIAHIHASFNNTLISITDNKAMLLLSQVQVLKVLEDQEKALLLLHRELRRP